MKLKDLYRELLALASKENIPELDLRDLLTYHQHYTDSRSFFLKFDDEIKDEKKIRADWRKMCDGYPVAYLTHRTTFLGENYYIDERVLIPRPETEELLVNTYLRIHDIFKNKKIKILDVGTGSGVIAIDLAKKIKTKITATDINESAIAVAKKNAKLHQVKIDFYCADTFPKNNDKYDVIIANPPYILREEEADENVRKYEPKKALFLTKNNNVYEKIIKGVKKRLNLPGLIMLEIAPNIEEMIKGLLIKYLKDFKCGYVTINDINKKARFMAVVVE